MAKDYNSYDFNPSVLLPGTLKRNGAWPLDMSALFLSVNDAIKYARGDVQDLDERKLGLQAYAGQIIGVKAGTMGNGDNETGIYDAYIIQGDGTLKKLSGSENNSSEETIIESSIVNVIIPNGEGSTLPEPVIGDYQLGNYFYNTTDEKLYILKSVNVAEEGEDPEYEIQWIVAPKTQPFISQDLTQVYFYHKDEETEIVKWLAEDGSSEKIYLSTNTSTLYYWDTENHIFTTNSGENNYVTNSIHFLKADFCVDEDGAFPELTQKEIGKVLIKYDSDEVYIIYKWTYDTSTETGEWVQILDPIYDKVIYFPHEPDTEYRLFKDDIDGNVVPGNNIYKEYTQEDKFQENVFYVNDLTGSVYGWNGEYMELLSNEELSGLLPKTLPITYCNTSHTYEMKKKAKETRAAESNWSTRYLPLLEAVKNVLTPLTIPAEYTLPVVNQESGICTVFNVLVKQEGNDKIVQYLYNSDVEYHRVKYPKSSRNEWRKWWVKFNKTDVKFEIKTIPNSTEKEDWEDNTYIEKDKYITVRVHSDNMEFVRLNEPYLTVSIYAKRPYCSRKHGSSNKWRAIHQPVTNERNMVILDQRYSLGYLPRTQQFSTYNSLVNNSSIYCSRVNNSPTYILPVTAKNLVQSLFKINIDDGVDSNDMNDERILKVLRFGCGTEKAEEEGISKVYSKIFHSGSKVKPFCTYGRFDETVGVRSIPSLSLILATNLVYCNNREINDTENLIRTNLIQCRLYVTLDQFNDVEYGFRDKLTKSISAL